jgi:hypothetical protein
VLVRRFLGEALDLAGRDDQAVARLREAARLARAELGERRLVTVDAEMALGLSLAGAASAGERAEGVELLRGALPRLEALGRGWSAPAVRARAAIAAAPAAGAGR